MYSFLRRLLGDSPYEICYLWRLPVMTFVALWHLSLMRFVAIWHLSLVGFSDLSLTVYGLSQCRLRLLLFSLCRRFSTYIIKTVCLYFRYFLCVALHRIISESGSANHHPGSSTTRGNNITCFTFDNVATLSQKK